LNKNFNFTTVYTCVGLRIEMVATLLMILLQELLQSPHH